MTVRMPLTIRSLMMLITLIDDCVNTLMLITHITVRIIMLIMLIDVY